MRGEYSNAESKGTTSAELPPRARRILTPTIISAHGGGTTSACAENTQSQLPLRPSPGNYLRVRGEYPGAFRQPRHQRELPPRARRILIACLQGCLQGGTTSACAENTLGLWSWAIFLSGTTSACAENTPHGPQRPGQEWNYLRVRGEYPTRYATKMDRAELPPRARRIRAGAAVGDFLIGTTSACAENTA